MFLFSSLPLFCSSPGQWKAGAHWCLSLDSKERGIKATRTFGSPVAGASIKTSKRRMLKIDYTTTWVYASAPQDPLQDSAGYHFSNLVPILFQWQDLFVPWYEVILIACCILSLWFLSLFVFGDFDLGTHWFIELGTGGTSEGEPSTFVSNVPSVSSGGTEFRTWFCETGDDAGSAKSWLNEKLLDGPMVFCHHVLILFGPGFWHCLDQAHQWLPPLCGPFPPEQDAENKVWLKVGSASR